MKKIKEKMQKLSIKQKWTFVSALTIIVSYAIISIILYVAIYNWLIHDEERIAVRTADDVQSFFVSEGAWITIQDIKQNTSLINAIVDQAQTVRIFNFDHYEIIRINNTLSSPQNKPSLVEIQEGKVENEKIKGTDTFVVYRPIQIGTFIGYLEIVHPLDKFHSVMKYILTLLFILGIGAVLLATILSRYIASLLLQPIQQLRNSMIAVRDSGIPEQTSVVYTAQDEIGDLFRIYHSMLNELKESFDRQQQFVHDASHELRTPIQAIEGHLSLIERWGKNDPQVLTESISTSLSEVRRMKKLMEELLMLARDDEKQEDATANVEMVVKEVMDELSFIHHNVDFNLQIVGTMQLGKVKDQALHQILRNIIENGIFYNENNPIIRTLIQYKQEEIIITITDNGIGIPQEKLQLIFNRFYQVDESRQNAHGGTGLGLSITKMLADKYDIILTVQSKVGRGTSFMIKIPS